MPRLLIVNADDYGLSPGVSQGILRAAQTGIVSSTTVMANLVQPADIAALIAAGLPAGAHLNLTCGPPLTGFPADLLDGQGWFVKRLNDASWGNPATLAAVRREWTAQIDHLLAAGLALTHLDSHHHLHLEPALFATALDLAAQYGCGLRTRALQAPRARELFVPTPQRFVEDYFGAGSISCEHLRQLISAPAITSLELMCHPGLVDPLLAGRTGYSAERETELAVLGDPALKSEVEGWGWRLGGYDELANSNDEAA